ncbi:hypothetical protein LB518_12960 [Mesorhizobium sp. BR1-1-16]|uniref:DUF2946 family protein n=1 Tax=Mesorhizobium sp. BR1-1-16 TaxID=2876653 RepID=UPI001CCEE5EB|nr:DUF2946 family protein [Mesorhizobium sp. BR1-1-16]MBZ9937207.1 hypothetical protein [Mesorhizobium sp. BR1-1-16]
MSGTSPKARWFAALALTLALALQAVFTSLALGKTDEQPRLDPFGHVLCLSGGEASDEGGSSPHGHGNLPDCCTFACSMFWPQLPSPDGQLAFRLPLVIETVALAVPNERVSSSFLDHRRSYPRAPPMTA